MDTIFNQVCVLVTAAFRLRLCQALDSESVLLLSMRDQGTALMSFYFSVSSKRAAVSHVDRSSERIVAVCAAGLVAGPRVGLAVGVFVTWLAGRVRRPAIRFYRNFHDIRWFSRRVAVSMASETGANNQ